MTTNKRLRDLFHATTKPIKKGGMRMEWISAKDNLPTTVSNVIIAEWNRSVSVGYISLDRQKWFYADGQPVITHITHWMPLPEPPDKPIANSGSQENDG